MLVPHGTPDPVVGNRAVWYDHAAQKMYHVIWTAARINPNTGQEVEAAWTKYSVCPLSDVDHPEHGNVQTLKDAPLMAILEEMLKLQMQERKERLDKERKDKERQEDL